MSALVRPVDNYVLQSSQRRRRRGTSAVFAALEFRAQFIVRLIDDLGSASSHDREYEKRGLECDRVLFDHGIGRQPSVYRSGGAVGEQVGERKNRLSGESLYRRGLPADVRVPPGPPTRPVVPSILVLAPAWRVNGPVRVSLPST